MKKITGSLLALFASVVSFSQSPVKLEPGDLLQLRDRMTGVFSSEQQSKEDSAFYHISLKMTGIWQESKEGYWLYVEQAMASALKKPYRQRIYHVYQQDAYTLVSKVYEMPNPLRFAGAADDPSLLASLTRDSLIDRQGCAIYLHKDKEGNFSGSTPGKDCLSSLRGAAYATSEVVIKPAMMISWDRGWNADGKQVWGAVKGGYRFDRLKKE